MPDVSVVIPTRNRPVFLARAVQSVLAQEGVDVEVLVIDDGGTEDLAAVVDQWPGPGNVIRTIRHETSRGVAAARNHGIREAGCRWVAFLDDDDVWAPHKLREQLHAMSAVSSPWCIVASVCVDAELVATRTRACPPDAAAVREQLCDHNAVPGGGSGVIASTDLLRRLGGFDESLSMVADWEMWHRLAHSAPCAIVQEPLVAYTEHDASMTAYFDDHDGELERLRLRSAPFCNVAGRQRATYWSWIADGLGRRHRFRSARIRLRIAISERSLHELAIAVRVVLFPTSWSVLALFKGRAYAQPEPPPTVDWLQAVANVP